MNWNKLELYDDHYPWAIKSEDGSWIIAKDATGNILIFKICDKNNKRLLKFLSASTESALPLAKELCTCGIEPEADNS